MLKVKNLTLNDIFYNTGVTMGKKLLDIMRDKIKTNLSCALSGSRLVTFSNDKISNQKICL